MTYAFLLTGWLDVHLQSQIIANFGGVNLLSLVGDDAHLADWWWSSIGNGSRRGQHGHVEAQGDVLLARLVDTLDVIGLCLVCDELGMLLYDQHKASNILDSLHTTAAKVNAEDFGTWYSFSSQVDNTTTLLILAVSLNIKDAIEARFGDVNLHLHAIGQATDNHVRTWEVGAEVGVIAMQFRIASVASNALTLGTMINGITEGIDATCLGQAGIFTGLGLGIAETIICALFVACAFGLLDRHTLTQWSQAIAQLDGASAATTFIDDHATFQSAHAVSTLVNAIALLHQAWCAVFIDVQCTARWTDTLTIHIAYEALLDDAQRTFVALYRGIASVSLEALTDHGAHWKRIEHATFGIDTTRLCGVARINALAMEAGTLRGTVRITDANRHHTLLFAAIASGYGTWGTGTLWTMLIDLAALIAGTDCSCLAGISAFAIHTSLVRGAFIVGATAKWGTTQSCIAAMSWRTLADSAMIEGQALCIGSTLLTLTGGHAELIAAGMCRGAFRIDAALDLGAFELRITLVSLATGAHRLVVLDTTLGIQSTIAWITADAIHTRLVGGTIRIGHTTADLDNTRRGFTASTVAANVSIGADADHGTHWNCWRHLTLCGSLTRLQYLARIDALFVDAGQAGWTIRIQFAHGLWLGTAIHIGIAQEVSGTAANSHVILWSTLGTRGTHIVVDTRIDALLVLAGLVRGAVVVAAAANDAATLVGIATVSAQATALGTTGLDVALGVGTTRIVDQAGIDAVAIDAGLARVTFTIDTTANGTAGDIGVTLESILATADGAMLLHLADGIGATVAWVAALSVHTRLLVTAVQITLASRRALQHQLTTLATGIGHLRLGTLTDHGANGHTVQHTAVGTACARREFCAWVRALGIDAGQFAGTITVVTAHRLHGTCLAEGMGITQWQLLGATADGAMLQGLADGILCTRTLATWIDTLVLHASQVRGTIVVGVTLQTQTAHKWITLQSSWTSAAGTMIAAIALGIQCTRI